MIIRRQWFLFTTIFVVMLFILGTYLQEDAVQTSGNPGLINVRPDKVLQGIVKHNLPAETIATDFLWGAGKFAVFEVHAPPDQDLVIDEIVAERIGGSDAALPSIWLRIDRKRVYTETSIEGGRVTIGAFPVPAFAGEGAGDIDLDGVIHRLMDDPAPSHTIPAGKSAIFEIFGIFEAVAISEPVDIGFCLLSVSGTLSMSGETTKSSLNKTCWNSMHIVPAPVVSEQSAS